MALRTVRSECTRDGRVVIWLPIQSCPVISLSVVQSAKQRIMWTILHESFTEATEGVPNDVEIIVTSIGPKKNADAERIQSDANVSLEYGVVPVGMRQAYPRNERATPLERGEHYVVTVWQTLSGDADHFIVELA